MSEKSNEMSGYEVGSAPQDLIKTAPREQSENEGLNGKSNSSDEIDQQKVDSQQEKLANDSLKVMTATKVCEYLKFTKTDDLPTLLELEKIAVRIFNKDHHFATVHSTPCIAVTGMITQFGNGEVRLFKVSNKDVEYGNLTGAYKVPTNNGYTRKEKNLWALWKGSLSRNTYEQGVTFAPDSKPPKGYMNLWGGWGTDWKQGKKGTKQLKAILWHCENVLCSGNEDEFNYLMDWCADMIQNPSKAPSVAVVMQGTERGTGKSTLAYVLSLICGSHCAKVSNQEHFTGKFNSHLSTSILTWVEESFFAGNHEIANRIRDLIDSKQLRVEPKGIDSFTVPKFFRTMMITNNEWAVPAHKDERRFFVLAVSAIKMQNKEYFDWLYGCIENNNFQGVKDFHRYLKERKITSNLMTAMKTKGFQSQVVQSLESFDLWLVNLISKGEIYGNELSGANVPKHVLHEHYISWFNKSKSYGKPIVEPRAFGRNLAIRLPSLNSKGWCNASFWKRPDNFLGKPEKEVTRYKSHQFKEVDTHKKELSNFLSVSVDSLFSET